MNDTMINSSVKHKFFLFYSTAHKGMPAPRVSSGTLQTKKTVHYFANFSSVVYGLQLYGAPYEGVPNVDWVD